MKRYFLFLVLLQPLVGCNQEAKIPQYPFYKVVTTNPNVDRNGVTFEATVEGNSSDPVTERGFVIVRHYVHEYIGYQREETVTETHTIPLDGNFALRLNEDWDPRVKGVVYAYLKTAQQNYRGENIDFTPLSSSPPEIHSVTTTQYLGENYPFLEIVISGKNFSKYKPRVLITIRNEHVTMYYYADQATLTELRLTSYIDIIGSYDIAVDILGAGTATFENAYTIDGPTIVNIPESATVGEVTTINLSGFTKETPVEVFVNENRAAILRKDDNKIEFLFPHITSENAEFYLHFPAKNIKTHNFTIPVPSLWNYIGDTPSPPISAAPIIINNEAYSYGGNKIWKFDKSRLEWQNVPISENIIIHTIFGKDDFIYIAGSYYEDQSNTYNFKYHIPSGRIEKSPNPIPIRFIQGNLGEWINNEYYKYAIPNFMEWDRGSLIKYSPDTDTWTILNNNLNENYKLYAVNGEIYALSGHKLYKYNILQQSLGELLYEFPYYTYIEEELQYTVCNNNMIYILTGHIHPYLYRFDLVSKELKSLGTPRTTFTYGYTYLIPFDEKLYLRCYHGQTYEYSGQY